MRLLLKTFLISITPGLPFGAEKHFRISYATSDDVITEGISRIKKYFDSKN